MKNFYKIIFLTLILSSYSSAQKVTWQKYYDYSGRADLGNDVVQTFEGGYIIAGSGTNDNSKRHILLIKIDYLGIVQWKKLIGESMAFDRAYCIQQTPDSGFVITGDADHTMLLIKVDKNGNIEWRKDFTETNANGQGYSLQLTNDGGIICSGHVFFPNLVKTFPFIVKTDMNGNLQWKKYYQDLLDISAYDIDESNNYEYYFCGADIVRKIDETGNTLWTKSFTNNLGFLSLRSLIYEQPNIIYAGGVSDSSGLEAIHLIKLDSGSNIFWEKRFLDSEHVSAGGISICKSFNSIVMTGEILGKYGDVPFVKVSDSGELIIYNVITSSIKSEGRGNSIKLSSDKGYIITGFTTFGGSGFAGNVLAIKTDSNGTAPQLVNIKNNVENIISFTLYQNYPNPFNPSTTIKFELKNNSYVKLRIYDISGKEIITLVNGFKSGGYYSEIFDASWLSSGIYFYSLELIEFKNTKFISNSKQFRKMIFLK
ncbi:MAG TPA: T9SS type A sorting domain-containing protein [Ignavibacteria bacterium]|nr:T9SS type A sorting domain-containing protein [Ignavibacteria bacterium]